MKLYLRFFGIHVRGAMEHKLSFAFLTIGQFLLSFNVFLGILFLFQRFHQVKGYGFSEVLLCFAMVMVSFSLAEMYMRGFDLFSQIIGNGEFDRMLLRPRSILLLVISSKVELSRVGKIVQSVIILAYAIATSDILWSIDKVITVILMIFGGTVIFSCLFIIFASICFFTLDGLEFMNVLTDGAKEYCKYPLDVYGKEVLRFCTFLIPYSLFQYYPFQYLTERSDNSLYILFPVLGCLFIIPSYLLWLNGVRHYKSTGS